jgi:hypothetical protein
MAKDSFAQPIGSEWVQLSILAGVIVFISFSGGFIHVFSPCLELKAGIPGARCKIGATYPGPQYAVSAPIILA